MSVRKSIMYTFTVMNFNCLYAWFNGSVFFQEEYLLVGLAIYSFICSYPPYIASLSAVHLQRHFPDE